MPVTVTNSSFYNYTQTDNHARQTTDTPGFKPFTMNSKCLNSFSCLIQHNVGWKCLIINPGLKSAKEELENMFCVIASELFM